ncbi:hypothetical protein EFF61_11120 [Salmonella enterica]|nr:hypothetical protein [Salmonella enterica]
MVKKGKLMKTTIAAVALLCGGLLASTCVMADTDSFSVGYTWLKPQYEKGLNGFSLGYQHEFVNGWGLLTSFAWATGDRSETDDVASGKFKYWSLMTGPTYRFNDYFGIYGQLGLAHFNGKGDAHYDDGDYEHWSESRSALCRYGEVIFTGIFSQLALPTSIHRLTGVIDVKTTMVH